MARLIDHNGRPAICVNGDIYPPMMATIRTMEEGKRILFDEEYFKALGESGIRTEAFQYAFALAGIFGIGRINGIDAGVFGGCNGFHRTEKLYRRKHR